VTAFILAGGKSARMGTDKAFVQLHGTMLIDLAMKRLKPLDCDIFIVGPREKFNAFGRVIEDRYAESGPLAGIHRALERSDSEWCVVTAVDTPLLPTSFYERLLLVAREKNVEAVVPRTAEGFQPLCAVYRKSLLKTVEDALKAGERKIDRVVMSRPHVIFECEKEGFGAELFLNVNTTEDLALANKRLEDSRARAAKR
jgi:molybdenum cofactor guanylyltransferase